MVTLPCVFRKTHGKVTKTNSRNSAFAVRFLPRRTAKRALCRAFFSQAHSKEPSLPFVFLTGARQRGLHAVWFRHRQLLLFAVHREKRTTKIIYRALSDVAHGKDALPCKMLPCALCRAPRRKTHGKGFVVRFWSFVVRSWSTAKPRFPVVNRVKRTN
jgi:hypothetical protein